MIIKNLNGNTTVFAVKRISKFLEYRGAGHHSVTLGPEFDTRFLVEGH